VYCTNLITCCS